MAFTFCTLTGVWKVAYGDGPDGGTDPDIIAVNGDVSITYMIEKGGVFRAIGESPSVGIPVVPVPARLVAGVLKDRQGNTGVRVLANVGLEIEGDLWATVSFDRCSITLPDNTVVPVSIKPFDVQLPTSDTAVDLIEETPVTGTLASGIRQGPQGVPGTGIADTNGNLTDIAALPAGFAERIVTPADFGAVALEDGGGDSSAAIQAMFYDYALANDGACILIPHGKTYLTDAFDVQSNTHVFGGGTLKCRSNNGNTNPITPGAFAKFQFGIHNVVWNGVTLDINGKTNVNGFDVGNADFDADSDYIEDLYIVGTVKGARVDTALEDSNNRLFAGGGKGMALGFRVRNCYVNLRTYDCDIAVSIESTNDNDRPVENVVVDLQAFDSHRTALFVSGGLDGVASSLDSGSYLHSLYPGVKVRLHAQGGQDASVLHPVGGATQTNYNTVGVVTLNYASGIDLEVNAAIQSRCTLVRGMANASNIRINALMDNLQDAWDTRPLDTLDPGLTYMPDNVFEANIHAATHSGVVIRPHRTSGNRTVVKSKFDVSMWCVNGVGSITQSDGTTDEFGVSVAYRFRDLRSNPVKEVVGDSSYKVLPTWSDVRRFSSLIADSFTADRFLTSGDTTATAAGTTTLDATSAQVQVFTGSANQTVKLPSTGVVAGQTYTVINNSTGVLFMQASNASAIVSQLTGKTGLFTALVDTPTSPSDWQITGFTARSSASTTSLALRDSDANLFANNFIPSEESTATAGGTTTLTVSNSQVQVFTGSSNQTVKLPGSSVTAGQTFTIINNSSGLVFVQASGGGAILSQFSGKAAVFVALTDAPTTAAGWQLSSYVMSSTYGASSLALRDSDGNLVADNFIAKAESTATAAGTTTLDISSGQVQVFTGSTTQTVLLPTTSVVAGQQYTIINNSSGSVTVQASDASTVATVTTNTLQLFVARFNAPTNSAHWRAI
jgi:hypothetical protein